MKKNYQKLLQDHLDFACKKTDTPIGTYKVRWMGKVKRYKSMKDGYFIQIQNFISFNKAKLSNNNINVRYYFRCIEFENSIEPLLEIAKWTPTCGNEDDSVVIWRSDNPKKYHGTFISRLQFALNLIKLKM